MFTLQINSLSRVARVPLHQATAILIILFFSAKVSKDNQRFGHIASYQPFFKINRNPFAPRYHDGGYIIGPSQNYFLGYQLCRQEWQRCLIPNQILITIAE